MSTKLTREIPPRPWRVSNFPHSASDVPWSLKDADGVVIIDAQSEELAEFIASTINNHNNLTHTVECAVARLADLPDFLYRNDHAVLAGIVNETLQELRHALPKD